MQVMGQMMGCAAWILVLDGECTGDSCVMMGGAGVMFNALADHDYYLVVDGEGDCTLQTMCSAASEVCVNGADDDLDGATDCADDDCASALACPADGLCAEDAWTVLGCGDELSGSTYRYGATDVVDSYACAGFDASGPEYAHSFVADADSAVTIDLAHGSGVDLDVYVLHPDCAGEACLHGGDDSVTFDAEQDKYYTVVVDGRDEEAGLYELTVTCVP
jgi:hypothetical protein